MVFVLENTLWKLILILVRNSSNIALELFRSTWNEYDSCLACSVDLVSNENLDSRIMTFQLDPSSHRVDLTWSYKRLINTVASADSLNN